MISFIIGFILGAWFGLFTLALCKAASDGDRDMRR